MDRMTVLRNRKLFGDSQVLVVQRHPFSYRKGLVRKMDPMLKDDLSRKAFYAHHYDAESNPAFTQICPSLILFNYNGTKIATMNTKDHRKSIVLTKHANVPGHTSLESLGTLLEAQIADEIELTWLFKPDYWGVINENLLQPQMHLYLIYAGAAKNISSLNETKTHEWSTLSDCVRYNNRFDDLSRSVIDHYFTRGSFNDTNFKKRRPHRPVSA